MVYLRDKLLFYVWSRYILTLLNRSQVANLTSIANQVTNKKIQRDKYALYTYAMWMSMRTSLPSMAYSTTNYFLYSSLSYLDRMLAFVMLYM